MKSFRGVLRRSMLGLVITLVTVSSVLIYWGLETLLYQYVDSRLWALADTLASFIEQRPELLPRSDDDLLPRLRGSRSDDERHDLREASHSVHLLAPDGRLIWQGSEAVPRPPMTADALERLQNGDAVFETLSLSGQSPIRRVSIPVPRSGEIRYILQAEASLQFSQKTLTGLLVLLVIVTAGTGAMAWASSRWLADKLTTPLKALSATVERISGTDRALPSAPDAPYEEFQQFVSAFNAMLGRLRKSSDSHRRFVDHAAHEMQTPLTVLQANLEVTLHKARTIEEYREALLTNLEQVERLVTLTRELLTLTRFAGDRPPVRLAPLALEPLVRDLLAELTVLADDRHIALILDARPVPLVQGDPSWLKQLLINLLDNALRYTEAGGTVTVRLHPDGPRIAVAVQDTGPGIEPHHLPHLFERFYRTDAARARDSGGTGLGLPIVKEIAEVHGGTITVESKVGKGTTFTLLLPALPVC
ncbi:HAMP domain-containing sensor histidine kinase [Candidatus Nitrospira bockiana]